MSDVLSYPRGSIRLERYNYGWLIASVRTFEGNVSPPSAPKRGDIIELEGVRYRVTSCDLQSHNPLWWSAKVVAEVEEAERVKRACTCCGSETFTKTFAYTTDGTSPEGVIGRGMPLDDPRTHHLCYVCATTNISASNKSMAKSENRIMAQISNILLDAIFTGKDPRENYGDPS